MKHSIIILGLLGMVFSMVPATSNGNNLQRTSVAPTQSIVATQYLWIRNFQLFNDKQAAVQATCDFVAYNSRYHKCPLNVQLKEDYLGYGLYVSFEKKYVSWAEFNGAMEKFTVIHTFANECKDPRFPVGEDNDGDGEVDRCILGNQIITAR